MPGTIGPRAPEVAHAAVNGGQEPVNSTKIAASRSSSMIFLAAILAATVATPDPKIAQVDADFHALSRIANLSDNPHDNKQVMLAIVDNDLETLREKRPDESYRWASLQREEASRVKDQKSVERVQTEKELREVTLTAANAYRVEVSIPTKQGI